MKLERGQKVMIDVQNMSFIGSGQRMEEYKSNVLDHANQIGYVFISTLGLVHIKFSDCTIVVPKNKIILLD